MRRTYVGKARALCWRRQFFAASLVSLICTGAVAETIGVSMARFDDNFLTILRNGMVDHVANLDGVEIQIEDAQDDVTRKTTSRASWTKSTTSSPLAWTRSWSTLSTPRRLWP